tara:strand:+ start:1620 stop:2279 length:660 start_codon:yes stop_codon:yes gene_type:complete
MTSRADYGDALANVLATQPRKTSPLAASLAGTNYTTMGRKTPTLKEKLMQSAYLATPEESELEFAEGDFRWGETKKGGDSPRDKPVVYLNYDKFKEGLGQEELTPAQVEKYFLGETLHNLKDVEPETYERLMEASLDSPEYRKWMEDSYQRALDDPEYKETRNIEDWHRHSRFDQVIGGYLGAGDKDYPTLKDWSREKMPWGDKFRKELEKLRTRLGME